MKAKIVWIEKRYHAEGQMHDLEPHGWTLKEQEPAYSGDLYDKYVLIPVEDD